MSKHGQKSPSETDAKLTDIQKIVLKEADQTVHVKTANGPTELTKKEALVSQLLNTALKGSPHAIRQAMHWLDEAQEAEAAQRQQQIDLGKWLKAHQQKKLDDAISTGEPTEPILPHPDDIIIDEEKGFLVKGPYDEDELKRYHDIAALRDALILQDALELKLGVVGDDDLDLTSPNNWSSVTSSSVLALLMNNSLPVRMQLSDQELIQRMKSAQALTKRELLKKSHQVWRKLNPDHKRGTTLPNLAEFMPFIESLSNALNQANKQATEDGNISQQETEQIVKQNFDMGG